MPHTKQMDSVLSADTEALWTPGTGYQSRHGAFQTSARRRCRTLSTLNNRRAADGH
jgi:hypothetical protein